MRLVPDRGSPPRHRLRRLAPVTLCLGLLGLLPGLPARAAAAPSCGGAARHAEVLSDSPKTADGFRAGEAWLLGPEGQGSMRSLTAVANDPAVIGLVPNYATRDMAVVYDRSAPTAKAVESAARDFKGAFTTSLHPSCRRRADLDAAKASILRADWGPSAGSTTLFAYLDGETDSVKVVTSLSGVGATELRSRFGPAVTVVDGNPKELASPARSADVSPHWGGSFLIGNHAICTAGFTAYNAFGVKGGSTAAHCARFQGEPFWTAYSTNPAYYYGTGAGNEGYPFTDFQWVWDPGQSYANVIHTDPCCPSQRTVTEASDPPLYSMVCADGDITGASCGGTVLNTDAVYCGSGFCRGNTAYAAVFPWQPFAQPGDSGGPMYTQLGSCCAGAKGMLIGGIYGNDAFFEKPSWMRANGLYIATS